jgi:hypothetical protein
MRRFLPLLRPGARADNLPEMLRAFRLPIIALALVALFGLDREARAWPYSFEFGGTMASLSNPSPLFVSEGLTASNSASSSFGVPLTLAVALQERQSGPLFSLGLQTRYLSGTTGASESFTALSVSPIFRIELWRLVVGAGYTPLVYRNLSFKKDGAINTVMTIEAEFLFPITPEIDFGLQASRELYQSTTLGNGPTVTEYGAFFRLNFGMSEAMAGERRKFKGWRYPLGSPLH